MCFVQGVVALTVLESLSFSNVIFMASNFTAEPILDI